jgi:hypothetical protein
MLDSNVSVSVSKECVYLSSCQILLGTGYIRNIIYKDYIIYKDDIFLFLRCIYWIRSLNHFWQRIGEELYYWHEC